MIKDVIDVQTGEVKAATGKMVLRSIALGSCVAVVAYDPLKKNGAIAHVMLPGKASPKTKLHEKTKYAEDAIDKLIDLMDRMGSKKQDFKVAVVGGANVLKRDNDTIANDNLNSNIRILNNNNLEIVARSVGGTERRNVAIDLENGIITYAHGNSCDKVLWRM